MWSDKTGICVTSRIIIGLVISNLVSKRSFKAIASNPIAALSRKAIVISRVACLDTSGGLKRICNARLNLCLILVGGTRTMVPRTFDFPQGTLL